MAKMGADRRSHGDRLGELLSSDGKIRLAKRLRFEMKMFLASFADPAVDATNWRVERTMWPSTREHGVAAGLARGANSRVADLGVRHRAPIRSDPVDILTEL